MDYWDAINEILDKAEAIKLPTHRLDVVSAARRAFVKQGCCEAKFIAPIEETLRNCLRGWTLAQKREIWLSNETGAQSDLAVEDLEEWSMDMDLEGELMAHVKDLAMKKYIGALVGHCPEMVEHVYKPVTEMKAEVEDFVARCRVLSGDIGACSAPLKQNPQDQFWRRVLVRNVFVLIEACAYGLKQAALHRFRHFEVNLSQAELALLSEEKYSLDGGEAKTETGNFQKVIPNLKFAFKTCAKTCGFTYELDASKAPLTECERVRNRLTHPKKLSELSISDSEMQQMLRLWKWFENEFAQLVEGIKKSSLPVRAPQVKVAKRLSVSGAYIVFLPNGYLYQFDELEDAETFTRMHIEKDSLPPVLFKTSDLARDEPN